MSRRPRGRSLPADAMDGSARAILQVELISPSGGAALCPADRFCGIRLLDGIDDEPQLHLSLFIHSGGHHEASWRHKGSSPLALTDIRFYQDLARRAEDALFDSIFPGRPARVGRGRSPGGACLALGRHRPGGSSGGD
jgi:hypothetical protein